MRKQITIQITILFLLLQLVAATGSFAWHDETHLAVLKAAGYEKWYNAAGPDIAKIKAGSLESNNHYFNNPGNVPVNPEMVLNQVKKYNDPGERTGHLYGAIIASLRKYIEAGREGKYAEYHLVYCAHYIGDLSNPLHNTPYDEFNKEHHSANDGVVDREVLSHIEKIESRMKRIMIRKGHREEDLAREVSRIANIARILGNVMREEKRDMTEKEAYTQLGYSASLLRAVLESLKEKN